MSPLRWGIAGCGRISVKFVAALNLLSENEHQVTACAARDTGRAQKFAKDNSIPKFYGSYQDMASDPDVDIVYIGTVHTTHCELSCLYMNAGKHVLCEKPLGMNLSEVQACVEAAKNNEVFFMEAVWSRFFPVYERLREELKKGTVGQIGHVSANLGLMNLINVDRIADKSVGGGVLMDIGMYTLQFALFVYGEEPLTVHAAGKLNENGVDWFQNITLTFSGNRTAQLTAHGAVQLSNDARVCGSKGIIEIPSYFWCPTEIIVNGEKQEYPLPGGNQSLSRFGGYVYEAQACREALQKGLKEHPLMTYADSLRLSKLLDQLKQQLEIKYDSDQ